MSSAFGRRAVLIVVIPFALACVGSYSRAVETTRAGLLGLGGRDLRQCLGVPSDFVIDGDVEQQSYRIERDDEPEAGYGAGSIGDVVIGSGSRGDPGHDPRGFPVDDRDESYCQLDFELTKGRVTRVVAQGRTREGLNADASCLLRARSCLRYADEDDLEALE